MDPLAELVKIDPKSIGVGQYQHDVDQSELKRALDDTVMSCVNAVGVDVNRASAELLTYVAGVGPSVAKNIVTHRNTHGPFKERKQLGRVHRLGPRTYQQCAGFLRIIDGDHPLDAGAVHPESYPIVENMAGNLDCEVIDLMNESALRRKIDISKYVSETIGLPTLEDIMRELEKPGRDPRQAFESFSFAADIHKPTDLEPGMKLPGIITNVTAFGAFVDIGVHQDGLVHISEMADKFVKDPAEIVRVQQKVMVSVLSVDLNRNRIGLSMKSQPGKKVPSKSRKPERKPDRKPAKKPSGVSKPRPFNNPFADYFKGN